MPDGRYSSSQIYDRPRQIGYRIDDAGRLATLEPCNCTWKLAQAPPPTAKADCSDSPALAAGARQSSASTKVLAGVAVWWYRSRQGNEAAEVALAPSFGCQAMEETVTTYNWFGLPTSGRRFRVRSYSPGEPGRANFLPPPGYRVEEKPLRR